MKKTYLVTVKGISSIGTESERTYLQFRMTSYEATQKSIEYANDEYITLYDENRKSIPNSTYKVFEEITSIEVRED